MVAVAAAFAAPTPARALVPPPTEPPIELPVPVTPVPVEPVTVHADLAIIEMAPNVQRAKVGQRVTFTIAATNHGPEAVSEIDIHAPSDASTSLRSDYADLVCDGRYRGGGPFNPDGQFCEFTGPIAPGETVEASLSAEVQATGSKYVNVTSCVTSFGGPYLDPNSTNDCQTATLRIVGRRKPR
jgi:uncharacterized repeat protein (TIGR01451 family)